MKTQEHKHICVIASQDTFARHCSMSGCLYDQDSCITIGMTCLASNVFQALTYSILMNRCLLSLLDNMSPF